MFLHHVRTDSSGGLDPAHAAPHQQDTICPQFTAGLAAAHWERERVVLFRLFVVLMLWVSLGCSCRTVFSWYFSADHFQPILRNVRLFLVQEEPLITALSTQIPDCTSLTELSAHRLVRVPTIHCGRENKGSFSGKMPPKVKEQLCH